MIEVTDISGRRYLLSLAAISRISEAGTSSQWHGVNSYIKTTDGATIECRQSVDELWQRMNAAAHEGTECKPAANP